MGGEEVVGSCIFNAINARHGARGGEGDNKQSIV